MSNDLYCAMISIVDRVDVCRRTCKQIPFKVDVFISPNMPLGAENHYTSSISALKHGADSGALCTLFLEDDLDICACFESAVMQCVDYQKQTPSVITLYNPGLQFYPASVKSAIKQSMPIPSGIYNLVNRRKFFGSQALLIHRNWVEEIITGWDGGYLDNRIAGIIPEKCIFSYVPNPVQHYGACLKSTWSKHGKPHTSRSFGWETD